MKTVNLVLGVHNHQPVGNFDHVFAEVHEQAYRPFLAALERHPGIRFTIHNTGVLLDWFAENESGFLDRLHNLVARDQVEILTGGYYEPILPVIPDHDKVGQIRLMNDEIERRFEIRPRGMWLAERVWEPQLPRCMREAGVEFTALDDSHFKCAGLTEEQTFGYYVTEDAGHTVAVFPINEPLRYAIPFHEPEEAIEYLRSIATDDGRRLVVMIDDGEKFGGWPGTHKHCYTDGWLERFLRALEENASWIRLLHFGEALDRLPPLGRVYLPTSSYREMMEWAMPADAIEQYEDFEKSLEDRPDFEQIKVFVRGGFWRNFLAKYDEGNHMHKRMIRVSEKIEAAISRKPRLKALQEARKALWSGQCNCAYWHGVFGGLYLNHLRSAVYGRLIEAEALLNAVTHSNDQWLELDRLDFDGDGFDEFIIESPVQNLYFKPSEGGALVEHDLVEARFNLTNVLGRRKEAYHRRLTEAAEAQSREDNGEGDGEGYGETASIHDLVVAKEKGLERLLHYDWHRRGCFVDHFVAPETTLEQFAESRQQEYGDFANQAYTIRSERRDGCVRLTLERLGSIYHPEGVFLTRVCKVLTVYDDRPCIDAEYEIANESDGRIVVRFGVEFVCNLLAGDAPDRYCRIDGRKPVPAKLASRGAHDEVRRFELVDEWLKIQVRITPDEPMALWRFPIETVSVSEAGFERVYQGSVLVPHTLLDLAPGETRTLGFRYEVLPYPTD